MDRRIIEAELKNIFGLLAACFDRKSLLKRLATSLVTLIKGKDGLLDKAGIKVSEDWNPEEVIKGTVGSYQEHEKEDTVRDLLYVCFWPEKVPTQKGTHAKSAITSFLEANKKYHYKSKEDLSSESEEIESKIKEEEEKLKEKEKEEEKLFAEEKKLESEIEEEDKKDEPSSEKLKKLRDSQNDLKSSMEKLKDSIEDTEDTIDKFNHEKESLSRHINYKSTKIEDNFEKYFEWFVTHRFKDYKLKKVKRSGDTDLYKEYISSLEEKQKNIKDEKLKERNKKEIERLKKKLVKLEGSELYHKMTDITESNQFEKIKEIVEEFELVNYKSNLYKFIKSYKDPKINDTFKNLALRFLKLCFEKDISVKDREKLFKELDLTKTDIDKLQKVMKRLVSAFAVDLRDQDSDDLWQILLKKEGLHKSEHKKSPEELHKQSPSEVLHKHTWDSLVEEYYNPKNKGKALSISTRFIPKDILEEELKAEKPPKSYKDKPKAAKIAAYLTKLSEMIRELI